MASQKGYEMTVARVVNQASSEIIAEVEKAYGEAVSVLDAVESGSAVEASNSIKAKKREAEIVSRQMIGSASSEVRSRTMNLIEDAVNKVFAGSLENLSSHRISRESLKTLLEECVEALAGKSILISTSRKDAAVLKELAEQVGEDRGVKIKVSAKNIGASGGIYAESEDGSTRFDNTFEARIERMKPELRKRIVSLFAPVR